MKGGIGPSGERGVLASQDSKEAAMRKIALAFAALALIAVTLTSVMKSTPTGAQSPEATVSILEMMSQATDLPVAPHADAI
jgi:uncharacterized membrane protein YozB (DUF420 family)